MKLSTKYNILDAVCAVCCFVLSVVICIKGGMVLALLPAFNGGMFWGRFTTRRDTVKLLEL